MTQRSGLHLLEQPVTASPSTLARILLYSSIDSQAFQVDPTDTTGVILSTALAQSANDPMPLRGLDTG